MLKYLNGCYSSNWCVGFKTFRCLWSILNLKRFRSGSKQIGKHAAVNHKLDTCRANRFDWKLRWLNWTLVSKMPHMQIDLVWAYDDEQSASWATEKQKLNKLKILFAGRLQFVTRSLIEQRRRFTIKTDNSLSNFIFTYQNSRYYSTHTVIMKT